MRNFWVGKNVLLTGHTGFKGSWLAEILFKLGAIVTGYALNAKRRDALFYLCKLGNKIEHHTIYIRDGFQLSDLVTRSMPDIAFHLTAQPLVLPSYTEPVKTREINVFGSFNLLESLKTINKKCAVIMVTTGKVYELDQTNMPKKEDENRCGYDPYSSSKAAMEIAVSSWRRSLFFQSDVRVATARAGDVIGGGDWSDNRIIPDLFKSLNSGADLEIKNAEAVRPWQPELESLFGYLNLAEALYQDSRNSYETSFNFGPGKTLTATVNGLVNTAAEIWRKLKPQFRQKMLQHEGLRLSLDNTKARDLFGWHPRWSFRETVFHTVQWNKSYFGGSNVASLIEEQIDAYLKT